jgi:Glycosyltransferase sugar-binding region containing DXD motif
MRFLPDKLLYTDTNYCLAKLEKWKPKPDCPPLAPIRVHFFWIGAFRAKQALSVKSLLATCNTPELLECWLWLDSADEVREAENNPHLAPLLPLLRIKHFQLDEERRDTPFANADWLGSDLRPAAISDIARLLVLHNYGGLYADLDTFFLRDINELRACIDDVECAYQWSYVPRVASAYLRLHARGRSVVSLMQAACVARTAHPNRIFNFDRQPPLDLLVLPSSGFSPLWLRVDGKDRKARAPFTRFPDFFRRFGWFFRRKPAIQHIADFFPGAFTYHWHNLWNAAEHADSYAGILDKACNRILQARYPDLPPLMSLGTNTSSK